MFDCHFCTKKFTSSELYINHLMSIHKGNKGIDQGKIDYEVERIQKITTNTKKKIHISLKKKEPIKEDPCAWLIKYYNSDVYKNWIAELDRTVPYFRCFSEEQIEQLQKALDLWEQDKEREKKNQTK